MRDLAEQFVAGLMAVRIVDVFEAVDVNEKHGHRTFRSRRQGQSLFQSIGEHRPVRQSRERVVTRLEFQLVGELAMFNGHGDQIAGKHQHLNGRPKWSGVVAAVEGENAACLAVPGTDWN